MNATETYDLNPLKEKGYIGKFKFDFFEIEENYPVYDTVIEVGKWLEEIRPGDQNFIRGLGEDACLYIKHVDLCKSFKNICGMGRGFIIHYGMGVKYVTPGEMKKIYPYDGVLQGRI